MSKKTVPQYSNNFLDLTILQEFGAPAPLFS